MPPPASHDVKIEIACRACGCRVTVYPAGESRAQARECLVCPVCWATGPSLEDALRSGAVECSADDGYRLLGCIRPDGPELGPANDGAPREMRELARMLWRLAGEEG